MKIKRNFTEANQIKGRYEARNIVFLRRLYFIITVETIIVYWFSCLVISTYLLLLLLERRKKLILILPTSISFLATYVEK